LGCFYSEIGVGGLFCDVLFLCVVFCVMVGLGSYRSPVGVQVGGLFSLSFFGLALVVCFGVVWCCHAWRGGGNKFGFD
jgi:hypothetical protein